MNGLKSITIITAEHEHKKQIFYLLYKILRSINYYLIGQTDDNTSLL